MNWWLIATILIFYAVVRRFGERFIQRRLGRETRPDNFIFYAGVYVPIMAAIMVSEIYLFPDASPLIFLITFCTAETIGGLTAQSLFGKNAGPTSRGS